MLWGEGMGKEYICLLGRQEGQGRAWEKKQRTFELF